jgi:hypothetical protein
MNSSSLLRKSHIAQNLASQSDSWEHCSTGPALHSRVSMMQMVKFDVVDPKVIDLKSKN